MVRNNGSSHGSRTSASSSYSSGYTSKGAIGAVGDGLPPLPSHSLQAVGGTGAAKFSGSIAGRMMAASKLR